MLCIEWWSFEVGVFLTGLLGKTELGAQSVIFQLETVSYMVSNITVGNVLLVTRWLTVSCAYQC